MRSFFLLVACATAVAACSSGVEQICEEQAETQCDFLYGCCDASERAVIAFADSPNPMPTRHALPTSRLGQSQAGESMAIDAAEHYDEASCVDALRDVCTAGSQLTMAAQAEARISLDDDAWQRCLAPYRAAAAECDAKAMYLLQEEPPLACEEVFVGQVTEGGACYARSECAAGSECGPGPSTPGVVEASGRCNPLAGDGDPCGTDDSCRPGLICHRGDICSAPQQAGENCEPGLIRCDRSLECDPASGTCVERVPGQEDTRRYAFCTGG